MLQCFFQLYCAHSAVIWFNTSVQVQNTLRRELRWHLPPQITLCSSGVNKIWPLRGINVAGCRPARSIARGKMRGTSTATPGMRMPRVFVRGTGIACTEAYSLPAAKWRHYSRGQIPKCTSTAIICQFRGEHIFRFGEHLTYTAAMTELHSFPSIDMEPLTGYFIMWWPISLHGLRPCLSSFALTGPCNENENPTSIFRILSKSSS